MSLVFSFTIPDKYELLKLNMNNKEELINKVKDVKRGLSLLGRNRKTVLSHHKTFELTDDLEEKIEEIRKQLEEE
tara:strand:+ start:642 stop:866 length:225 start_codon:yes stop_codon:yes gene_type:complete